MLDPQYNSVNYFESTHDGSLLASLGREGTLCVWKHFDCRRSTPNHLPIMRSRSSKRPNPRPHPILLTAPEEIKRISVIASLRPSSSTSTPTPTSTSTSIGAGTPSNQGYFLTGDDVGTLAFWDANLVETAEEEAVRLRNIENSLSLDRDVRHKDIRERPRHGTNTSGMTDYNDYDSTSISPTSSNVSPAYIHTISKSENIKTSDPITALTASNSSLCPFAIAGYMNGSSIMYDLKTCQIIRSFNDHYNAGRSVRQVLFIADDYDYHLVTGENYAARFRQLGCFCHCHEIGTNVEYDNTYQCGYCSCGDIGRMYDDDDARCLAWEEATGSNIREQLGRFHSQHLSSSIPNPYAGGGTSTNAADHTITIDGEEKKKKKQRYYRQSETGELVVTAGWDSAIHIYDIRMERPAVTITQHTAGINALTHWKPQSCGGPGLLASAGWDRSIYTWDIRSTSSPMHELKGHSLHVTALSSLPTGELVSVSRDRTLRIWDLEVCPIEPMYLRSTLGGFFHDNGKEDTTKLPTSTTSTISGSLSQHRQRAKQAQRAQDEQEKQQILLSYEYQNIIQNISQYRRNYGQYQDAKYVTFDGRVLHKKITSHYVHPVHPWACRSEYALTADDACVGVFMISDPISSLCVLPSGTIITGVRECVQKVAYNGFRGSMMCWDSVPQIHEKFMEDMLNPVDVSDKSNVVMMGWLKDREDLKDLPRVIFPATRKLLDQKIQNEMDTMNDNMEI